MQPVIFSKIGGLGDCLSALPTIAALRAAMPARPLTVLTSPIGRLVMEGAVPDVSWLTVHRDQMAGVRGVSMLPGLLRALPKGGDGVLSPDECTAAHLALRLVSRRTIGFSGRIATGERLPGQKLILDIERSVYDVTFDLARTLSGQPDLVMKRVSPAIGTLPVQWLEGRGVTAGAPYGLVHPTAAVPPRCWDMPPTLLAALTRQTGFAWIRVEPGDGLDLPAFAALVAGARAFVGLHSGPLHLAAALGTPWVALAGPTGATWDPPWADVPGRAVRIGPDCQPCSPFGTPVRGCPHGLPPPCLAVPVGAIISAVEDVLNAA